jgi:hypothetical protein
MNDPYPDWVINGLLNEARTCGIRPPVAMIVLNPQSSVSQAIFADRNDTFMPGSTPTSSRKEVVKSLPVPGAAALLRKHGGIAGAGFGALFTRPWPKVELWLAQVQERYLGLIAFGHEKVVLDCVSDYNDFPALACPKWARNQRGLSAFPMRFNDGPNIPVCGHSPKDAIAAKGLVRVVVDRKLRLLRDPIRLPVDDHVLAAILREHYIASPRVVAEAIAVLRKRGKEEDLWLLRILESQPELEGLARGVQQQLGGE